MSASSSSVMPSSSAARAAPARRQAHVVADLAGDEVVVAGQDLHGDAVLPAAPRSPGAAVSFGGSRNATYPSSVSPTRRRSAVGLPARRQLPVRDGQHAEAVARSARRVVLLQLRAQSESSRDRTVSSGLGRAAEPRTPPRRRPCRSGGCRSPCSTTTDMRRRSKSNGISSTLRKRGRSHCSRAASACCRMATSSRFLRPVW